MTLVDLIRKRGAGKVATAIPAIPATRGRERQATVAGIATVAVAGREGEKSGLLENMGDGDAAIASRRSLIHYPYRDPVEVACCPDSIHGEILERHPEAVTVEPLVSTIRQPLAPLIAEAEKSLRAWLAMIGETDPAIIAEVIERCRADQDARDYFTRRAVSELPHRPSAGSWPPQIGG